MKTESNHVAPLARAEKLVVKELANEALVYDLEHHTAHCLNHTAFLIWKNCDGTRTVPDIAGLLTKELGSPVSDEFVWFALDQLSKDQLLMASIKKPIVMADMSRRRMMKRLSVAAAIAVPVVTSLMVPPVNVHASVGCPPSCTPTGGECNVCGKTCISGTCM